MQISKKMKNSFWVLIRTRSEHHSFNALVETGLDRSGRGVHGYMLYDDKTKTVLCHECGAWRKDLSRHIHRHNLRGPQYRTKHGLVPGLPLAGLETLAKQVEVGRKYGVKGGRKKPTVGWTRISNPPVGDDLFAVIE